MYALKHLFLAVIAVMAPILLLAEEFSYTYEGQTLNYEIEESSVVSVYSSDKEISGVLIIPETVEHNGNTYKVEIVGYAAFENCKQLTSVTLPSSIELIRGMAFAYCSSLCQINLPENLNEIQSLAFYECKNLSKIYYNARKLDVYYRKGMEIGYNKYEYVPDSPFSYSPINEVIFGTEVKTVPSYCFKGHTELKQVTFLNQNTGAGVHAFAGCTIPVYSQKMFMHYPRGLKETSFEIPEGIELVGECAFEYAIDLESVVLPTTLERIYKPAFANCSSLRKVDFRSSFLSWEEDDCMFNDSITEVTIGENVIHIPANTFSRCWNIKQISYNAKKMGAYCDKYGYVVSPFDGLYLKGKLTIGKTVESIPEKCFMCIGLTDLELLEGVASIGDCAFMYNDLTTLNIPKSVKSIGYEAFLGNNFSTLYIPETITEISDEAFAGCGLIEYDGEVTPTYATYNFKVNVENKHSVYWCCDSDSVISNNVTVFGEPNKSKYVEFGAIVNNHKLRLGSKSVLFPNVEFEKMEGQAMNTTTALLAAKTNIGELEENVGFEWRRYDAPESLPSQKVACTVVDGVLMGALSNLNPEVYYNYRPYYQSNDSIWYGEWMTVFTGDANVHFDPTVRTYKATEVNQNSATLKGYALRGSDEIKRQGFQYWSESLSRAAAKVNEVEVKGQRLTVTLSNLEPGTTYVYRTFVETNTGTIYGDEQQFKTEAESGIDNVQREHVVNVVGYYDVHGVRSSRPHRGFNIVLYSDGTTRKMLL